MDDVACGGYEFALSVCRFPGWGIHDCTHAEDAGVVCTSGEGGEGLGKFDPDFYDY